jgi:hypothetical protein
MIPGILIPPLTIFVVSEVWVLLTLTCFNFIINHLIY